MRIGAGLHVTAETAARMLTLKAGRASKDDVASALVLEHGPVYAQKGDDNERHDRHSMGVRIDEFTPRQQEYRASWTHGT
jgi:S-adenosylhomocysteine hydrolase